MTTRHLLGLAVALLITATESAALSRATVAASHRSAAPVASVIANADAPPALPEIVVIASRLP